jgi:microcystin-dependent protein
MTSYNRDYWMAFGAHQKPTTGDMKFSAAQYDHLGWIMCDGREVDVSKFQFLYNVIGNSFGTPTAPTKFRLPNPAGRVPGVIGTTGIRDPNPIYSTITLALGSTIGEYQHKLTIPEMPSHNHGTDSYSTLSQSSFNNSTSMEYTGLSVLSSYTGVTDAGHSHGYRATNENNIDAAVSLTTNPVNAGATNGTTGTGYASISDPGHIHNVNDPGHRHTLNPAGLDNYHNNIQPTIGMGNMFIYSGLPQHGSYPYTTGKNLW